MLLQCGVVSVSVLPASIPFPTLRTAGGSTIWFMSQYGVECTVLCVCRQLERTTSLRSAATNRRRQVILEVLVCCFLPMLTIPLRKHSVHSPRTHEFMESKVYSLSSTRYMIMEDFGCLPAIYPSKLSMALAFGPQLILAFLILSFSCEPHRDTSSWIQSHPLTLQLCPS